MANDPTNPERGEVVFNGVEFTYLVDLEEGALQGMRTAQPGFEEAISEILSVQAEWGAKAGVTADDFQELLTANARIGRLDAFIGPVAKFLEMLTETRYMLEDRRQRLVLNIAKSVDRRAVRLPQLLAKYQKTREYRSASAKKGAKTRKKNAGQGVRGGAGPTTGG